MHEIHRHTCRTNTDTQKIKVGEETVIFELSVFSSFTVKFTFQSGHAGAAADSAPSLLGTNSVTHEC